MFDDLRNAQGERLDATFHAGAAGRRDLVVLGHGVTGNKDRPFATELAAALAARGIAALRFSFAGNGQSEGRFEDATVSKEVRDLGAVLDAAAGWRIAYVGHSMGAAVGVIRASEDARIRVLVSLGGMVETGFFAERKFGAVVPGAATMWDEPDCPLSQAFMDDMRSIGSTLGCTGAIKVPWLLVHGTADDVVLPDDSRRAAAACPTAKLVEIEGCDHVFSRHMAAMVEKVSVWVAGALDGPQLPG